eukprot:CAMPEP_0175096396 /NCGR_PEP_ID=MMETSP0086_2-20121207/4711_1 /TAXON_ID=136419 /ORGANISM="Unknown Unknown, Strain D1" /LENGTH=385 /DNA_ID=CAMNT_0016369797 /DNA_START=29 /DNA_END=1186 /DNA_ORIENTATION=-
MYKWVKEAIGRKEDSKSEDYHAVSSTAKAKTFNILVIDSGRQQHNWYSEFQGATTHTGQPIVVEQGSWEDIRLTAFECESSIPLSLVLGPSRFPLEHTPQAKARPFSPHLVLVRNETRQLGANDFRHILFGFMYAGIPAINSWESIYGHLERPVVFAELKKLQRKFGQEHFPLVSQAYFPSFQDVQYYMPFPCVVKVGHAHAGYGKILVKDHKQMEDVKSVLALANQYSTAERFVVATHDLRIQRIGNHMRAYKRTSVSGSWKTNTGTSMIEEIEMKPRYRFWAEEAAKMFGGMDIITVDVVVAEDGEEFILEVNGTASGLAPSRAEEDNHIIRDLVLQRISTLFPQDPSSSSTTTTSNSHLQLPLTAKQERELQEQQQETRETQ